MDVMVLPNSRDGKVSLSRKAVLLLDSGVALGGGGEGAPDGRPGTPGGGEGRRRQSRTRF
jgi:hypothetical protein